MNFAIVLKKLSMAMAGAAFVALGTAEISAATTNLTFDELPFQAVDDLSFQGVTFNFAIDGIDSTDANYNSFGPGSINFVNDPSLEGNTAGTLTLDFDMFISELQFGVALEANVNLTPGFTVELFDLAFGSLGVTSVNTSPLVSFSEGLFSYTGAPVKRAVVNFNETSANRFTLDNLTFTSPIVQPAPPVPVSNPIVQPAPPVPVQVPEPASGLGFFLIGALVAGSVLKKLG
ncbi:MAG: PEP-CTERM sorting domain-containing protein [Symploca sp. SIO2E6]|nr:PEP-CTERM sorting domain-containing protein [Symploca sp. SIO2E6]